MKKRNDIDILTYGGLGDTVLLTPSLKALKQKYPSRKLNVFCLNARHKEVLRHNPFIDHLADASFRSSPAKWIKFKLKMLRPITYNYTLLHPTRTYSTGIADVIAELLGVELKDKRMRIYLTEDEKQRGRHLSGKYNNPIVINPNTEGTTNKKWITVHWERLIQSMPEFTFIQLGARHESLISGAIDLRGISIRDSIAVINASRCYVGIDSFMAHAATAVDTPAIVLFGATQPEVFGHPHNENLYRKSHCSPCFETLVNTHCPYGRECMLRITPAQVKKAILKKLGVNSDPSEQVVTASDPVEYCLI